jgi:uncharacterized membrane protein
MTNTIEVSGLTKVYQTGKGSPPLAVFGMTLLGTLFSLYLTYLEPLAIRAVCAWCLTSAAIITLLILLSLPRALQTRSWK